MFSIAYLAIAVVDVLVLIWALRLCARYWTNGVIFASFPLFLVWSDNVTIGLGSTIGEGPLLEGMNAFRFIAHFISLPMSFIAIGAMAREAGFAWARSRWVMGGFCLATTYFIVHDLWQFSKTKMYPACFADTLRYTTNITEFTACSPDADIGAGELISPAPAIILTVTVIVFGIYLWRAIGWKWLALLSVASMAFFAVPPGPTGGIVANVGEPIFIAAIVATAAHISESAT
ncbi:MAG: hypothetical protein KJO76_01540 [Gammaproteobacteria bacterium]|nr:hypothetical protein [Gammaproteobacteria bacterium]MBT8445163.1 hypothetical protein [Gammaproteobacteria bacterium]NND35983.1 hypothetical protein [Gammaproteobacteria bacterium]